MTNSYNFYLFSRLVIDTLIKDNNFSIPYDIEMECIEKSYNRCVITDNSNDPYNDMVKFILNDKQLLLDLQKYNEGGF